MKTQRLGIIYAILAALCYSLVNPINKLVNNQISPLLSASMLYFGTFLVGATLFIVQLLSYTCKCFLIDKKLPIAPNAVPITINEIITMFCA